MAEVLADWRRVPEQTRDWVATCLGTRARVVRVASIGVSSTAQHSVDVVDRRGVMHRLVLRRFVRLERLVCPDPESTDISRLKTYLRGVLSRV